MTKRDKILEKIKNNPRNVNKKDFISLLSKYGFEIMNHRGKAGHIMYRHPLYKEIPVRTVNITDPIRK
ncbi:hypothetical protein [Staphylococcus intermedius]|uniref:hypothetical protein n=1 Tax=Staphylococcus intermedius TaxID=1285 RepID=UPI00035FE528|nr:hypothetical protein [Staphylococcus intermedius]PCF65664.1 hypothetical protein B5C04_06315 [Staphylococcus intermedius]PCF81343.1 hypothetical protein B4W74_06665 [Staphylococcus intermedius]PCF82625.1 hypothetical protein B4W70_06305 [Staphylococcus intermedius]PCF87325.1 hypothetical protein B4W75_09580 [Staphylococcus intermedius]PCF87882.1 hypothetical protein B4W76_05680 [Staphylococcus intermedius]